MLNYIIGKKTEETDYFVNLFREEKEGAHLIDSLDSLASLNEIEEYAAIYVVVDFVDEHITKQKIDDFKAKTNNVRVCLIFFNKSNMIDELINKGYFDIFSPQQNEDGDYNVDYEFFKQCRLSIGVCDYNDVEDYLLNKIPETTVENISKTKEKTVTKTEYIHINNTINHVGYTSDKALKMFDEVISNVASKYSVLIINKTARMYARKDTPDVGKGLPVALTSSMILKQNGLMKQRDDNVFILDLFFYDIKDYIINLKALSNDFNFVFYIDQDVSFLEEDQYDYQIMIGEKEYGWVAEKHDPNFILDDDGLSDLYDFLKVDIKHKKKKKKKVIKEPKEKKQKKEKKQRRKKREKNTEPSSERNINIDIRTGLGKFILDLIGLIGKGIWTVLTSPFRMIKHFFNNSIVESLMVTGIIMVAVLYFLPSEYAMADESRALVNDSILPLLKQIGNYITDFIKLKMETGL